MPGLQNLGCDPAFTCPSPFPKGAIEEFKVSTGQPTLVHTYPARSTYMPTFLALDGNGHVWFTDPTNNAIGELTISTNSWTEFTTGISPNSSPMGLILDKNGNLWFAEPGTNKIGFFNTTKDTVVENGTGITANSQPYGLTYNSANNVVWFTEDSAPKIGSFPVTTTGTATITEHTIATGAFPPNPHMITRDSSGNLWYSMKGSDLIGEFIPGSSTSKTFSVAGSICPTPGVTPTPCTNTFIAGIGVDSSGTVWFDEVQTAVLGSINPTTNAVNIFSLGSGTGPQDGLGVDASGNVWVAELFSKQVGVLPSGTTPPPSPTSTSTPSPTPTPPPANMPVSKQWYFGEGRVGAGFTEWLTLGNPTPHACQVTIQYASTSDGGISNSKQLAVSVPANTRVTQSVNQDLGIGATSGGNSVSTSLSVDPTATPQCTGIVAERPIYNTTFGNPLGVNSGTDVIGATHTGKSFYFADVRTGPQAGGGSVSSFIPILNSGTTTANVTATYFVGGSQVGSQTLAVPAGTRGTIYPSRATPSLPARVAAQVTSDQPVLIERPSYFNQVVAGHAGTVSGEADVVGVQQPAKDFLFAEGYTGEQFQEDLVLANFNPTTDITNATLLLEYANGATFSFPVNIAHQDQTTIDINQWTANPPSGAGTCLTTPNCATTQDVSIEVKTSGRPFVAERELYFHYSHQANGRSLSATGVSDVTGQVGPAAATAYSFAEGYTNSGYDEWLTLQNPTANPETIAVTLANADGRTYPFQVTVGANSRATVDITAMVIQHLIVPGDTFRGYEVSMSLSSTAAFVAERPMYFNASGYQGGDDQIGYAGG